MHMRRSGTTAWAHTTLTMTPQLLGQTLSRCATHVAQQQNEEDSREGTGPQLDAPA